MASQKPSAELLDLLNQAIAREIQVSVQYMWQHVLWKGVKGYAVKDAFKMTAISEMKHAEAIAERLNYLGGIPTTKPAPIFIGTTLKQMIETDKKDEETAIALFRVFQEALTNVSKHARARKVDIRLTQEDDDIVLEIADDGRGLSAADLNKPKSFGLRGIRERVAHLNGRFEASGRDGGGTRLLLRIPACRRTVLEFAR